MRWTKAQENTLELMFNAGSTDEEIAQLLSREVRAVSAKRARLGLLRKESKRWTADEISLIRSGTVPNSRSEGAAWKKFLRLRKKMEGGMAADV